MKVKLLDITGYNWNSSHFNIHQKSLTLANPISGGIPGLAAPLASVLDGGDGNAARSSARHLDTAA